MSSSSSVTLVSRTSLTRPCRIRPSFQGSLMRESLDFSPVPSFRFDWFLWRYRTFFLPIIFVKPQTSQYLSRYLSFLSTNRRRLWFRRSPCCWICSSVLHVGVAATCLCLFWCKIGRLCVWHRMAFSWRRRRKTTKTRWSPIKSHRKQHERKRSFMDVL